MVMPNLAYASSELIGKQEVLPQASGYICTSNECAIALYECENFADDPKSCLQRMGKAQCIPCLYY